MATDATDLPGSDRPDDEVHQLRPLRRHHWRDLIRTLDPVADAHRILRLTAAFEFPWDYQRALELALYRTYCVPSVSEVLEFAGEFRDRPQKRYDDTALLMAELLDHGYDSPRGREALRVVNHQHGRYDISNDDMLYVLSTFIYEPIDWIDRYGWRRLEPNERLAMFHFYREVGLRMGTKHIPADIAEFRRWRDDYEARTFARTDDTVKVGAYTLGLMESWYLPPVRPVLRAVVNGLIDEPMRHSFGYPHPSPALVSGLDAGLRARAAVLRAFPARKKGKVGAIAENRTYPGYPDGYRPADLGACPYAPARRTGASGTPGDVDERVAV